jgi:hypothetical protein
MSNLLTKSEINLVESGVSQGVWVSVKDGMPPYGQSVLVFLDFHGLVTIASRTHTDAQGEHWSCEHFKYVTHWMFLPVPPIRKVL